MSKSILLLLGISTNLGAMKYFGMKQFMLVVGLLTFCCLSCAEDKKALEDYTGFYMLSPTLKVEIKKEAEQLVLLLPGQKVPLEQKPDGKFYMKSMNMYLNFIFDDQGNVTKVEQLRDGVNVGDMTPTQ